MGRVEPELAIMGTSWVFINFHYGSRFSKDDNLVVILKQLSDARRKDRVDKPVAR
jgi:hypothetical protein